MYYLLPYVHATDEIRLRGVNGDITPERAYSIVLETTGDEQEATKVLNELSLKRAMRDNGKP